MKEAKKNELISYIESYKEVKEKYEKVRERFLNRSIEMTLKEREDLRKEYVNLDVRNNALAILIANIVAYNMEGLDGANDGK